MKRISELYTIKTVLRRERENGQFLKREKLFKVLFNPDVDFFWRRISAKTIDFLLTIGLMTLLYKNGIIKTEEGIWLILIFLFVFMVLIPITEALVGSSPGKLVMRLEVVDDYCKSLKIPFSIFRNLVICLLVFKTLLRGCGGAYYMELYDKWQTKKKFYVIKKKEKSQIQKMLKEK